MRYLAVVALLAAGCSHPTYPSPAVTQVAGAWTGVMATSIGSTATRFDLTQRGADVEGSWRLTNSTSAISGRIVFGIEGQAVVGSISIEDGTCIGGAALRGQITDRLVVSAVAFEMAATVWAEFTPACDPPFRDMTWTMTRQ